MSTFTRSVSILAAASFGVLSAAVAVSCSSSSNSNNEGGTDAATGSVVAASCAAPGKATAGPADTHCDGQPAQPVDPASCHPAPGTDAGGDDDEDCPYGATLFGNQGIDDDCKYKVSWTAGDICEGAGGVEFTVTITSNVDNTPVTGSGGALGSLVAEAYIPTDPNASCDDTAKPTKPVNAFSGDLVETAVGSGVYKGKVVFNTPGDWTVRFHIHEDCADLLPTSQHGHAAFRVTVP